MVSTEPVFELRDVSYNHGEGQPDVLDGMSFSIRKGSRTAILGANGAGKTTLFYALTGVWRPQKGEILFDGEPLDYSEDGLTDLRSCVAVVLQNPDEQLFSSVVEEDVAFGPLNLGLRRAEINKRIDKVLKEVRMSEYRFTPLQQLSGGQRKRIAIAGALAVDPDVIIMDEPTAGLDPQSSMEVMELAEKLHLQGVTVIIATHDIDLAYSWADEVHVLRHGRCVYSGDPEGFFGDSENVFLSGEMAPSAFIMNRQASRINNVPESPYPKDVSGYLAKFGEPSGKVGKVYRVRCGQDGFGDLLDKASGMCRGSFKIGVYGSDARCAAGELGLKVEFFFNAIDSCLSEAVMGRDSVLIYDSCYDRTVREKVRSVRQFRPDVHTEVVE